MKGKRICIVVDSTADLIKEYPELYGYIGGVHIEVVPLNFNVDGKSYKDTEEEMSDEDFNRRLEGYGDLPTTSAPSTEEFMRLYKRLAEECDYVLDIHISTGMSGTFEIASSAAEQFLAQDESKDLIDIQVVDTHTISVSIGFLVDELLEVLRMDPNIKFSKLVEISKNFYKRTHLYVAIQDIETLARGGRVAGVKRLALSYLRLKVIVNIRDVYNKEKQIQEGKIELDRTSRTMTRALKYLADKVEEAAISVGVKRVGIVYTTDLEYAAVFAKTIVSVLKGNLGVEIDIKDIPMLVPGKVVRGHAGRNAIGVCFLT